MQSESGMVTDLSIGKALRRLRKKAGLTQHELGELAGLDQSSISQIERGDFACRVDTLSRLAGALQCSVADIDERLRDVRQCDECPVVYDDEDPILNELLRLWQKLGRGGRLRVLAAATDEADGNA